MRIRLFVLLFALVWISLLIRVFYLSIQSNEYYEELSDRNTIKTELVAPVRGEILDRNNEPVAINKLGFRIRLQPHLSHKNEDVLHEELDFLISMLPGLDKERLLKNYRQKDSYYNHNYIDIVDFVSYEEIIPVYSILNLRERLKVVPSPKRYYPNNDVAAHIIGYVAKANQKDIDENPVLKLIGNVGKNGVEKYYDEYLRGIPGQRVIKVSAYNEEIEEIRHTPAEEHRKLVLNIDMDMQRFIKEQFKDKAGAVIVMRTDGAIIAAGSYPEYDLNTFVSGISVAKWQELISDIDTPFTNKLVNGLYPPGSTIKTGLGLIYITNGISEWHSEYCSGSMKLGKRNFRCWKHEGHEQTNLIKAIRESCDDYFYKGSLKLGIEKMSDEFKAMGLGKKTGVDLPNEFIGTVPSRVWKRQRYNQPWYRGETLNTSIGQGDFLTTPLQIAQFTALMATGKLPTPRLAMALDDQNITYESRDVLTPQQKKKLPLVQRAMREVCIHKKGTATHFLNTKVKIAGKTGTAQVVGISQEVKERIKEHEMEYYRRSHAWLTTYGPYKNPQYIVTVLVEHGGHGGAAAGGIVSKIYNKLAEDGYIK